MWVPKSAAELEDAARSGNLEETHTFEAKRELPQTKKNVDVAIDVCAMTVDGGVVVWGVGEDEHDRPTLPAPFELKGQPERVDLIVRTSLAEVPFFRLVPLPLDVDPARGYLVAVVPPSGRAPHQVLSGGELRYYGRGDKANRILTEGEVAQLYARRAAVEVSAERLLGDTLNVAPFGPEQGLAYLHAFVRPVPPDDGMYDRAEAQATGGDPLRLRLQHAIRRSTVGGESVPQLRTQQGWSRRGADVWSLESQSDVPQARRAVRFDLNMDGRGYLFCGRAGETPGERPGYRGPGDPARPRIAIFNGVIRGNLASFHSAMAAFYEAAGYHGLVDVGVAITNAGGGMLHQFVHDPWGVPTFTEQNFTRTARVAADALAESDGTAVADQLMRRFFDALRP